jgi:hypothetical protein
MEGLYTLFLARIEKGRNRSERMRKDAKGCEKKRKKIRDKLLDELPGPNDGSGFWKGCKPNSVPRLAAGENHLSEQPVPETRLVSQDRSEQLRSLLFGLAPDGVFRASSISRRAVVSYTTFSPLPRLRCRSRGGLFSVALSVGMPSSIPPVSIPDFVFRPTSSSYTASRSLEFGLSSPAPPKRFRSDSPPFPKSEVYDSRCAPMRN